MHPTESIVCPTCNAPAGTPCQGERGPVKPSRARRVAWVVANGWTDNPDHPDFVPRGG